MSINGHKTDRVECERVERWVGEHASAIRGFLYGLVGDLSLAEDLMQDVFCKAWQARESYRDQGKERSYLLRIADRLARDARRKARSRRFTASIDELQAAEPVDRGHPLARMLQSEAESQLRQALNTLTEPQRRTLLLRYYGDLSFSEIAEIMDCPTNTVLSHCHRGLQTLKRILTEALP